MVMASPPTETISTRRVPPGVSASTTSPAWAPTSALPMGEPGDMISMPSRFSSIDPSR